MLAVLQKPIDDYFAYCKSRLMIIYLLSSPYTNPVSLMHFCTENNVLILGTYLRSKSIYFFYTQKKNCFDSNC